MRKFSEAQRNYIEAKALYDAAVKACDWVTVESVEDAYIDAEFALVTWMIDTAEATGNIPAHEVAILRKNWLRESKRIIEMAMMVAV